VAAAAADVPYLKPKALTAAGRRRSEDLPKVGLRRTDGGSAERTREVRLEPRVDAFSVESVAAER